MNPPTGTSNVVVKVMSTVPVTPATVDTGITDADVMAARTPLSPLRHEGVDVAKNNRKAIAEIEDARWLLHAVVVGDACLAFRVHRCPIFTSANPNKHDLSHKNAISHTNTAHPMMTYFTKCLSDMSSVDIL